MKGDFGYVEERDLGKTYDIRLLRRIGPFIKPYGWHLCGAVLFILAITLLELAVPYVTKTAIDRYIVPKTDHTETGLTEPARTRKIQVSRADPDVAELIDRYPGLFTQNKGQTTIAITHLDQLQPPELLTLRKKDLDGLLRMTGLFLLLVLGSFGCNYIQLMVMELTGQKVMHDLRMALFDHLAHLHVDYFSQNPTGRLVTRVTNDVQNMSEFFTSFVVFLFKDLFLLIGICAVMLSLNWRLALVAFAVVPLVMLVSVLFAAQVREAYRTLRIKVAEINARFAESVTGMRVIQLFGQEQANSRRFHTLNHENYRAGIRQIHVFALFMPAIEVLSATALALIIYAGGRQVLGNQLTLGLLVAFIAYIRMFFRPIRDIAEKYNIMQNALASAERIFQILDTPREGPAMLAPARLVGVDNETMVQFQGVSFHYTPGKPVLQNIHLTIANGETVAVVGSTGSGKTTLINLILRFYNPVEGRILLKGRDIQTLPEKAVRRGMALVAQDPYLFSGTLEENIRFGNPAMSPDDLERIVTAANCRHLAASIPRGLQYQLSEGGGRLSSGEKQLIAIARALARAPELIMLDEATSHIDSETEQIVNDAVSRLLKGRAALVVAHRLSTARQADRIAVLHRGRIVETGSHDELMIRKGFYYHLYQLQA